MKLGEALSLRARQAQKMNDLRGRIRNNALVQEGETPAEDAQTLIDEYTLISKDHAELLAKIGRTNAATETDEGTLADTLHVREDLRRRRGTLEFAAAAATPSSQARYMRSELRYESMLNVQKLRSEIDSIEAEIRAIDARVQEVNWRVDLDE